MGKEPKNLDISKFENVERPKKTTYNNSTCNLLLNDISLKQVLDLTKGSMIELSNKTTEPIKLLANGYEIAKGEVVIIEDNFGIRITEINNQNFTQE